MSRWLAPLVLLTGCFGGRGWSDDDVWWETGAWWDTADRADTDGADVGSGGVVVTYGFVGAAGCEEAGLDSLALRVGASDDVVYLCNDEPLRLFELAPRTYQVVVVGETVDGQLWRSEPGYVEVAPDVVSELVAEILCVDGGTGACPTGEGE